MDGADLVMAMGVAFIGVVMLAILIGFAYTLAQHVGWWVIPLFVLVWGGLTAWVHKALS